MKGNKFKQRNFQ